jgi:hypothetical protein
MRDGLNPLRGIVSIVFGVGTDANIAALLRSCG